MSNDFELSSQLRRAIERVPMKIDGQAASQWLAGATQEVVSSYAGKFSDSFVEKTQSWVALALKQVVGLAVAQGYERVAFVSGVQSVKTFGLARNGEGMLYFYDQLLPQMLATLIKKLAAMPWKRWSLMAEQK